MVNLNSKLYAKAFSDKWLGSLAVYAKLQQLHSGKKFYFGKGEKTRVVNELAVKAGMKSSSLYKHLKVLQKKNLVFFNEDNIQLASHKQISHGNETLKVILIPDTAQSLKQIKQFLVGYNLLSNIYRQQKAINSKKNLLKNIEEANSDKFIAGLSGSKRVKLANRSKPEVNKKLEASNETICKVLDKKAKSTATKYKKVLKELKCLNYYNEKKVLMKNVSYKQYLTLKEMPPNASNGNMGLLNEHTSYIWDKKIVIKHLASQFYITKPIIMSWNSVGRKIGSNKLDDKFQIYRRMYENELAS